LSGWISETNIEYVNNQRYPVGVNVIRKKIYITGIAGLLGYNIVKELKEQYKISGVDLAKENVCGITYDVFDLCDYDTLKISIETVNPDVLIHTAALVNVDNCEIDIENAEKINAELTKVLADICNEKKIKMIYISTDSVFDGKNEKLYTEDDSVNPPNVYAKTKYQGEMYVRAYDKNLVLRTNIYGLNLQEKKSFGEWIVDSLKEDEELNMFKDIYFSPILVNDLAKIIDACIVKDISGLYHACGTGAISKYDFGEEVKKVFLITTGKINKITSDSMKFKATRPKHMGMSNQRIKSELGINIRTPKESIHEFYRLYLEKERCSK